jgi:hypothetical protein
MVNLPSAIAIMLQTIITAATLGLHAKVGAAAAISVFVITIVSPYVSDTQVKILCSAFSLNLMQSR